MGNQERTTQIFDAALKIFARYGYKKTTVEDIARDVGMTKGNLYFYFKDKRDLYNQAVAHALLKWQSRVAAAVEQQDDVADKFVTLAAKSYEYLSEDDDLRTIITNDPSIQAVSPEEDRFPQIGQASVQMLRRILQQGVDQGRFRTIDVEYITGFLYSIYVMFIIKTYIRSEGQSALKMYQEGVDVILHGLLKKA
jgi:AcrR family transcriptional regulator